MKNKFTNDKKFFIERIKSDLTNISLKEFNFDTKMMTIILVFNEVFFSKRRAIKKINEFRALGIKVIVKRNNFYDDANFLLRRISND